MERTDVSAPLNPPATPVQFEPEFVAGVRELFEQRIPFNALLGLKIEDIGGERVHGRIDMRPELVGHFVHNRIHGGVISACLDAMGGLAVMAAIGARHLDEPPFQRLHRFGKLGTIDLRIDYLRPGRGQRFTATATPLRAGNKVAVIRMELHNDEGVLVAVGTGTYLCG